MKPNLYFSLELDYDRTSYSPVSNLVKYMEHDATIKKYRWLFKVEDLGKVTAIIGKPITLEGQENNISKLINICPPLEEEIMSEHWKGVGYVEIIEFPKIFKIKTVIRKQENIFIIPRENVEVLWKVLL